MNVPIPMRALTDKKSFYLREDAGQSGGSAILLFWSHNHGGDLLLRHGRALLAPAHPHTRKGEVVDQNRRKQGFGRGTLCRGREADVKCVLHVKTPLLFRGR